VGPLRTYRHTPNTGSRKSWAAGDATSRGVQLAWMTMQGEMGYNTALTAHTWGLYDVLFNGEPFTLTRPLENYVIENVLFKITFPAEFHAQTAVECAIALHSKVRGRLDQIKGIKIYTQEPAIRIIDKLGPLNNPADRDHCLQYMVAVALLSGQLTAEGYEDAAAQNPKIDHLRSKMQVVENPHFTSDYLHPDKRSIAATLEVEFTDQQIENLTIEYPLGHRRRRSEGTPLLFDKFKNNLSSRFDSSRVEQILHYLTDDQRTQALVVPTLVDLFN